MLEVIIKISINFYFRKAYNEIMRIMIIIDQNCYENIFDNTPETKISSN